MNRDTRRVSAGRVELLTADVSYSFTDVCTICQLDEGTLQEYIDYGVITNESSAEKAFRQSQLDRLLRARRLQHDLELNHAGVALALELLDTIEQLKRDLALLRK
jgi:chaperone modulatory protein CbpM